MDMDIYKYIFLYMYSVTNPSSITYVYNILTSQHLWEVNFKLKRKKKLLSLSKDLNLKTHISEQYISSVLKFILDLWLEITYNFLDL